MNQFAKDQVQDIYYLSPMQEGMLYHTLLHPEQSFYMEQMTMQVKGSLQTDWLEKSLNVLVDRYDIFRTIFLHEKLKRPVQVVLKQRHLEVRVIDLSGLSVQQQEEHIRNYKQQDQEQEFDLSKDLLMRTTVFKLAEEMHQWIWSYHHILLDGWCFGIIIDELFQVYNAYRQNKPISLPPAKPFKEYINWLEQQDKEKSLNYWRQYLAGFEGQTTFAEQRKKCSQPGNVPAEVVFQLTEEETRTFAGLASEHGVTLSTALQATWAVLLNRYQRVNDLIFGTVVSGRSAAIGGVERMVGLFINVVPHRVCFSEDSSFHQLMIALQQQLVETEEHQYVPLYEIQSQLKMPELIDHIIVFENYPVQTADDQQQADRLGFTISQSNVFEKSNFDLNLLASPGIELMLKIVFNSNGYDLDFILRLKDQLLTIIRQICQNPYKRLKDIRIVAEQEQHLLLSDFNRMTGEAPNPLTIPQWLERYAEQTPDQIALAVGEQSLTYAELNAQANQLARELHCNGVDRGSIVALMVQRSLEMIIGILAILKAGGAYVPIDPDYPEQRIRFMLEDSGATLVMTQQGLAGQVTAAYNNCACLLIDNPALYCGDAENLATVQDPNDLAYVIYTSGTTGNPKGTLTTHANITRVVKNTNYIEITGNDRLLSLSNYAFDGFTFDLFGALLNGAKLVIAPKETVLQMGQLMRLIEHERITVMFITTALFNLLVDAGTEWMKGLRKVLFGGERSSVAHVRKALQAMGVDRIIHVYGPTETTVFAMFYPVNQVQDDAVTIPIGKPLNLTGAYILGPANQLQPIEAIGELCLSGTGLARGYLNRPDLTGEKFISHPYLPGQRLYRSGDLARWLPDGNIELVGRIDDQVKIRGHRIELGEIEAQLLLLHGVKEAVVLALSSDTGENTLCAYVVGQAGWV